MTTKPLPQAANAALLSAQLTTLQLLHLREHYEALAAEAARKHLSHVDYLAELIEGELHRREQRSLQRRIRAARMPVLKSLDGFDWGWPTKINREQIQNLFRLAFLNDHSNVVLVSNVGLGEQPTRLPIMNGESPFTANCPVWAGSISAAREGNDL